MESVGQAKLELFHETEVKTRKSGITAVIWQAILESLRNKTGSTLVIAQGKTIDWTTDENDSLSQRKDTA